MKKSVALCTYNGEKFLRQQLDSILNQTVKVDEIVVCDDGSTDRTIEILQNYQQNHPQLFQIHHNAQNLGSVKNFEKSIRHCSGDIIFFSDQDDVWREDKVKVFIDYFQRHDNIEVVCSNGYGIDEKDKLLDVITIWDVPEMLERQGKSMDFHMTFSIVGNIATGANMALRRSFLPEVLPFPQIQDLHHDGWIAMIAARCGKFGFIPEKLTKYRQHSSQQVGGVFYPNNAKTSKSLISYFTFETEVTSFSQGKKMLKHFAASHKKNQALIAALPERKEIFEQNVVAAKDHYDTFRNQLLNRYWFRARLQFLADNLLNKRKLNS